MKNNVDILEIMDYNMVARKRCDKMLYSVEGVFIKRLPHITDYNRWRKCISDFEYEKIVEALNLYIDDKINIDEPVTAGWITGPDWTGGVYEPIYYACGQSELQAGFFFGLILFKIMMERPENWIFGRFFNNGKEIGSMTYFLGK